MANEISLSASLSLNNGSVRTARAATAAVTQASPRYAAAVQSVGTVAEAIVVPSEIATPGYAMFINQGTANFVEIGTYAGSTFTPFLKLKPGESALLRLGTASPYARADTAAVDLETVLLAD